MKEYKLFNMKFRYLLLAFGILLCLSFYTSSQKDINSSLDLIKAMKAKYDGRWFKNFTFKQSTIIYNPNGTTKDPVIWYESVGYPNHFRIDRDIVNYDYVIYKNDSAFYFRKDTLALEREEPKPHLLFKGGLYFMELSECIAKLKEYGYNLDTFKKSTLNGELVYVIGDENKQFWIHATHFYAMRRIYTSSKGQKIDAVYDDFKRLKKGWVEQKVTFYFDGKKRMEEFYQEIKYRRKFDPKIYDQKLKYRWYLEY